MTDILAGHPEMMIGWREFSIIFTNRIHFCVILRLVKYFSSIT